VEKVIITLRAADADEGWCTRLRVQVAADLLEIGAPGLATITEARMRGEAFDRDAVAGRREGQVRPAWRQR